MRLRNRSLSLPALVLAVVGLCTASSFAQTRGTPPVESDFSVATGLGTLGFTVGNEWQVSDRFALRGMIGHGSFGYEDTVEGESYVGDVEAFGVGVLADYYPFGRGFRLTGGAFLPDYDARLVGRNVTIGAVTSSIEVDISDRQLVSPTVALGYSGRLGGRLRLSGDIGAMYVGGFDVEARDPSGTFSQSDIDTEISSIRSDLDGADVVPYVTFSIGMSF